MGFRSIRLAPIFDTESSVGERVVPKNLTKVSPILGNAKDLRLLSALLHEREMFIYLDFPLAHNGKKQCSILVRF